MSSSPFVFSRVWKPTTAALALSIWACADLGGGDAGETGASDELEADILASIAREVMAPRSLEFAEQSEALTLAVQAWADAAEGAEDTAASLAAAREAWVPAWESAQRLDAMQLGPAGASGSYLGGEGIRDELYSWPSINPCRIDQELVSGEYANADFVETRLVNVYGYDALEYLLFWDAPANSCAPQLPINAEGQWDALGSEEIGRRRAAYAAAIAQAAADQATALADRWQPGDDFHEHLLDPTREGSPYPNVDETLDDVMRAMFYLDSAVKDLKVGKPAGIFQCGSEVCLDGLESPHALDAKAAVIANLEAFAELYFGGPSAEAGTGFDDALISIGREDLATEMDEAIEGARAELAGFEGEFREALLADPAALDEVHARIKVITDLLKGEFTVALALDIPSEAGGDAD